MNIGLQIKNMRKKRGLTQNELAEKLGVTASVISQYETGVRNPKNATIERIAAVLDCSYGFEAVFSDVAQGSQDIGQLPEVSGCDELELVNFFRKLNDTGKQEALKRIRELAELDKYKK